MLLPILIQLHKLLYERSVVLIPNTTGVESANTNEIGQHSLVARDYRQAVS